MDLKSGYPYWAVKNGLMQAFPPLQDDVQCDVVIVGGGITAALIAQELTARDFDVVVVEQRDIGWGSSAASTALLQYEIDTHLVDLARQYDEKRAVLAYSACAAAIRDLHTLAKDVRDVEFAMQESLYYASRARDVEALRDEFRMRVKHGFDVEWLDTGALRSRYALTAPAGILSRLAARVDPYRMAHRLFQRVARQGNRVFDRTVIEALEPGPRSVRLRTRDGVNLRCRHAVLAAGYASQQWLSRNVAQNRSSYAFITDPIDPAALGPLANTLVWESARPYLYLRSTGDGRLLVGGEDDAIDIPARRDRRVEKKARVLERKLRKLFPHLPLIPSFSWAGTFAETADGLPFFGPHTELGPRVHFALAYGGNGITYSMIGAGLIAARLEGRKHPLADFFSFGRVG